MKNFYLNFNMNQEDGKTIQFIDDLEEYESSIESSDKPIANIYVSSPGGENRMAAMLYHFFKTSPYNYQFIINGTFSSNTILVLLALNPTHITIMRQCLSTIHFSNYDHPVANIALNDCSHSSLNEFKDFKDYLKSMLKLYKTFLTKKELLIIKQGGDVVISAKRVAKLFKEIKENTKIQNKAKDLFEITL